jgi:hypothetical protein
LEKCEENLAKVPNRRDAGRWRGKSHREIVSAQRIGGAVMLNKCSNPSCSTPFRHLQDGKLFRMENDPVAHRGDSNRMEYFWLCDRCSCTLTLRLREDGTVVAVPMPEPIRGVCDSVALALTSVDRKRGLVLRRVRFRLPEKLGDRTSKRRGKTRIENGIQN